MSLLGATTHERLQRELIFASKVAFALGLVACSSAGSAAPSTASAGVGAASGATSVPTGGSSGAVNATGGAGADGVAMAGATMGGAGTDGGAGTGGALNSGGAGMGGASGASGAAGASGTAGEAGSGACAGLFCEDFEQSQGQLDAAKWDLKSGAGGTEMIQQQTVAHGKYALHVHGTGAKGDFAMILTKSAPAALQGAGPVFGRAYFYTTANNNPHVELGFAGTTGYPNLNYMEFAEFGGGSWQLGFDLFTPAPSVAKGFVEEASYTHPGGQKQPVMTWSCLEWEFGDDPDLMVLWVDGTQIDQFDVDHIDYTSTAKTPGSVLNGKSSGIIGGFSVFGFGFHAWGSGSAFDLYYDDIVLDAHRVGCLPATPAK
ncbi:MAG TPA: hypothetical protein VHW01_13685 [Polyangiaceae bacterium]|nr:hypothetical protein [Polyangiaceae bacterium]